MAEPGDPFAAVLDELATAVPRLVTRTRRQVDVARNLATLVVCRRLPSAPAPSRPSSGERVPLTVVDVVAEDWRAPEADAPPVLSVVPDEHGGGEEGPVPDVAELALDDYDALAASQVVPRLGSLSAEQLELVRRYERGHRNRQTILHRVGQLLDAPS